MELKPKYSREINKNYIGVSETLQDFIIEIIEDSSERERFYELLKELDFKNPTEIDKPHQLLHGYRINFAIGVCIDFSFYVIWGSKPDEYFTLLVDIEKIDSDYFLDLISDSHQFVKFYINE